MGAWGSGGFENDTAMDWAADVRSVDDVRKPFERLKRDTDAHGVDPELVVDADFACELIAAAECVAMTLGRKSHDFPDDLAERLSGAGEPENLLFHQARNGVLHVLRNSELAELWEETATESDGNAWIAVLTGLIDRLNPDIEPTHALSGEPEVGAGDDHDTVGTCAFCNKPIRRKDLWGMRFYDAYEPGRAGKKSYWVHLPCANARLHHKHAVADFKFDPDNMPDLDKL
jgi:hypothetical protein